MRAKVTVICNRGNEFVRVFDSALVQDNEQHFSSFRTFSGALFTASLMKAPNQVPQSSGRVTFNWLRTSSTNVE
jgi:hypothetical protein